jgi:hypothetical protein
MNISIKKLTEKNFKDFICLIREEAKELEKSIAAGAEERLREDSFFSPPKYELYRAFSFFDSFIASYPRMMSCKRQSCYLEF